MSHDQGLRPEVPCPINATGGMSWTAAIAIVSGDAKNPFRMLGARCVGGKRGNSRQQFGAYGHAVRQDHGTSNGTGIR